MSLLNVSIEKKANKGLFVFYYLFLFFETVYLIFFYVISHYRTTKNKKKRDRMRCAYSIEKTTYISHQLLMVKRRGKRLHLKYVFSIFALGKKTQRVEYTIHQLKYEFL
jgi:hypothetical protein